MKNAAINWLAGKLMPKPVTLSLDPVVHQIGHTAVAKALATSETLESPDASPSAPVNPMPPALPPITAAQPGTPEYHLGLMNQMIETLSTRIERAETKRADQREAYDTDKHQRALEQERSDMEQAAEIAGLVKSLEAYRAAHDVLDPPTPGAGEPVPAKPARRRPARPGQRDTFVIPPGHEAVVDAEGRATGETRPIHVNPSDRDGDAMS